MIRHRRHHPFRNQPDFSVVPVPHIALFLLEEIFTATSFVKEEKFSLFRTGTSLFLTFESDASETGERWCEKDTDIFRFLVTDKRRA